ncbi:MAG: L,D-transpeptidase [Bdellovibrionota bacterium]
MTKIVVRAQSQTAEVYREGVLIRTFRVSTGKNGLGSERGSLKTPLGRLRVARKVGEGHAFGTVFRDRIPTGEMWTPASPRSEKDLITTRILWLEGLEEHNANTFEREVYFHGTNQEHLIGTPASHGCIRLTNADIVELYELVPEGAEVEILS